MPGISDYYSQAETSFGKAIDYGVSYNEAWNDFLIKRIRAEDRKRRRLERVSFIADTLATSSRIYDVYKKKSELIETGKRHGFNLESSAFNIIFGNDLKFTKDGSEYGSDAMEAIIAKENKNKYDDLLKNIFGSE